LAVLPRRALPWLCLSMIATALGYRTMILAGGGGLDQVWINTLTRLDAIAVGALIALGWNERRRPVGRRARALIGVVAPLTMAGAVGLLCHELLFLPGPGRALMLVKPGAWHLAASVLVFPVVALCCGAIVLAALTAPSSWLGHPALVHLGRISYG